jgi:hypothetical protein
MLLKMVSAVTGYSYVLSLSMLAYPPWLFKSSHLVYVTYPQMVEKKFMRRENDKANGGGK